MTQTMARRILRAKDVVNIRRRMLVAPMILINSKLPKCVAFVVEASPKVIMLSRLVQYKKGVSKL